MINKIKMNTENPIYNLALETVKREIDLTVQQGEALLKYQSGDYGEIGEHEAWESLKEDLIELHEQSVVKNIEGFIDFVDRQDGNDLPNRSSGSFMTALLDIDGLLGALGLEDESVPEEIYEDAVKYYTEKVQKTNNPKFD
jgi:hypothetical protein